VLDEVEDLHRLAVSGKLVINDLRMDDRTKGLSFVTRDPRLRFYAGVPIIAGGRTVGTLAVMDQRARPDGLCLLQSAALSGFAACASLIWDPPGASAAGS